MSSGRKASLPKAWKPAEAPPAVRGDEMHLVQTVGCSQTWIPSRHLIQHARHIDKLHAANRSSRLIAFTVVRHIPQAPSKRSV